MAIIVVFNEYITICEKPNRPIIKNFAYGKENFVVIMGLERVAMRTSANCNILRKLVFVLRQVGV
jgi:hypothetical protein